MPTPIELIMDPISLIVLAIYAGLIAWEMLFPARVLPRVKGWQFRGLSAFVIFFFLSSYLPLLWSAPLAAIQLFDLTALSTWGGIAIGLLLYELGVYVWHRSMHASTILWRGLHQMHHSAERLDSYSAFWFSPLDMVGWIVLQSICLTVVGLNPAAITGIILITTFMSIFQHSNFRTPRWLGYVIQRPESHSHHHERGVHARNYSDLPIFDLLFGTFYNPREFAPATGFYDGASAQIVKMLSFTDLTSMAKTEAESVHTRENNLAKAQ